MILANLQAVVDRSQPSHSSADHHLASSAMQAHGEKDMASLFAFLGILHRSAFSRVGDAVSESPFDSALRRRLTGPLSLGGGKQMYALLILFGVFGLRALGCLGFKGFRVLRFDQMVKDPRLTHNAFPSQQGQQIPNGEGLTSSRGEGGGTSRCHPRRWIRRRGEPGRGSTSRT